MIGLFIFGSFITAIVALACWLVVTGFREDSAARKRLAEEGIEDIRL